MLLKTFVPNDNKMLNLGLLCTSAFSTQQFQKEFSFVVVVVVVVVDVVSLARSSTRHDLNNFFMFGRGSIQAQPLPWPLCGLMNTLLCRGIIRLNQPICWTLQPHQSHLALWRYVNFLLICRSPSVCCAFRPDGGMDTWTDWIIYYIIIYWFMEIWRCIDIEIDWQTFK